MSVNITTAFVEQFQSNVTFLAQQRGSRLRGAVMEKPLTGEVAWFEQIGATEAVDRTSRHADSPLVDTPHERRKVTASTKEWGDLIDDDDQVQTLIDPTNAYALNAGWALGRSMDTELLEAALGTAYKGKRGTTSVSLPSSQKIAMGGAGLTLAKLREAKEILQASDVDEDNDPIFMAITAKQLNDLLSTTEVASADYNTVKALVNGQVNQFLGINFIRTQRVNLNGTTRECPLWAKSGLGLAIAREMVTRISERADKSYSTYVYLAQRMGATRIEEEKVVQVDCDES